MKRVRRFFDEERGQDLIEYTLLMAFLALASAALIAGGQSSFQGIWGNANNHLSRAGHTVGAAGQCGDCGDSDSGGH